MTEFNRGHIYALCLADMPEESRRYFEACARIRHISCTRLIERLLKTICADQLVLSVLDDDSKPCRRMHGEHGNSRYRNHNHTNGNHDHHSTH